MSDRDRPTEPMLRAAMHATPAARDFARFARAAYECFRAATMDGPEMPPWDLLADRAKDAWMSAARGVVVELSR